MESPLHSFLASPLGGRRVVLADLDGCLVAGGRLLPGAAALAGACGSRIWIVSNNSADTAHSLSGRLAGMGLDVAPDRVLLAGEQTVRQVAARLPAGSAIRLMADAPLRALAADLGLDLQGPPQLAVLARWTRFDFDALAELCALAGRGVPVLPTNPDLSHPGPDGLPSPETGALMAAVIAATQAGGTLPPLPANIVPCAKPTPFLLAEALRRAGAAPEEAVMIGDNTATDGLAAAAAGVAFHLVRHHPSHALEAAQ